MCLSMKAHYTHFSPVKG